MNPILTKSNFRESKYHWPLSVATLKKGELSRKHNETRTNERKHDEDIQLEADPNVPFIPNMRITISRGRFFRNKFNTFVEKLLIENSQRKLGDEDEDLSYGDQTGYDLCLEDQTSFNMNQPKSANDQPIIKAFSYQNRVNILEEHNRFEHSILEISLSKPDQDGLDINQDIMIRQKTIQNHTNIKDISFGFLNQTYSLEWPYLKLRTGFVFMTIINQDQTWRL